MDQACYGASIPSVIQAPLLQQYPEESRWLENAYKGPNAHWIWQQWKRLWSMVCGANFRAVSEPMGQHSVSSKTGSDGCAVLAMD